MRNVLIKTILFAVVINFFGVSLYAQQAAAPNELSLGEKIYKKRCLGCHGPDGNVKAFGISRKLTELGPSETAERLNFFLDRSLRGVGGATGTMHKQTTAITKQEYEAVLDYVTKNISAKQ